MSERWTTPRAAEGARPAPGDRIAERPAGGPLAGRRIVVTRAAGQAAELADRLRALGAEPLVCPAIRIAPLERSDALDAALGRLETYDWLLFTSANGVRAAFARRDQLGLGSARPAGLRIGAIGPATAAALAERGWPPDFVPTEYVAEAIVAQIGDLAGERVLLLRADIARPALAAGLRARGALVDEVAAYRTVPGAGAAALLERLRAGQVDAVTFTSSSTVRYLLSGLEAAGLDPAEARALLARTTIACIGPITAEAARAAGLPVAVTATEYTTAGLVAALAAHLGPKAGGTGGAAPSGATGGNR